MNIPYIVDISEHNGFTHLTFDLSGDFSVSKNQIEQINSFSSYLLLAQLIEKPRGYIITYDAGSSISLSKYFRQNYLGRDQAIKIIKSILTSLEILKKNRFYVENISFDTDYIFWDNLISEVRFVYLPFETGNQYIPSLISLLSKIFGELLMLRQDDDFEFINQIMNCYKQSNFTPSALIGVLDGYKINQKSKRKKQKKANYDKSKKRLFSTIFKKQDQPLSNTCQLATDASKLATDASKLAIDTSQLDTNTPHLAPNTRQLSSKNRQLVTNTPHLSTNTRHPAINTPTGQKEHVSNIHSGTEFLIPPETMAKNMSKVYLAIKTDGMTSQAEILKFPCLLGRSQQESDIVLNDKRVSRKHALIENINGCFYITDCNSSNGVFKGGTKLNPGIRCPIIPGDVITIGHSEIQIIGIDGFGPN